MAKNHKTQKGLVQAYTLVNENAKKQFIPTNDVTAKPTGIIYPITVEELTDFLGFKPNIDKIGHYKERWSFKYKSETIYIWNYGNNGSVGIFYCAGNKKLLQELFFERYHDTLSFHEAGVTETPPPIFKVGDYVTLEADGKIYRVVGQKVVQDNPNNQWAYELTIGTSAQVYVKKESGVYPYELHVSLSENHKDYKIWVGHYEKSDVIREAYYLTGPGLDAYYYNGKLLFASLTIGALDDPDLDDLDLSGASGAIEITRREFKHRTGLSIYDVLDYVEFDVKTDAVELDFHPIKVQWQTWVSSWKDTYYTYNGYYLTQDYDTDNMRFIAYEVTDEPKVTPTTSLDQKVKDNVTEISIPAFENALGMSVQEALEAYKDKKTPFNLNKSNKSNKSSVSQSKSTPVPQSDFQNKKKELYLKMMNRTCPPAVRVARLDHLELKRPQLFYDWKVKAFQTLKDYLASLDSQLYNITAVKLILDGFEDWWIQYIKKEFPYLDLDNHKPNSKPVISATKANPGSIGPALGYILLPPNIIEDKLDIKPKIRWHAAGTKTYVWDFSVDGIYCTIWNSPWEPNKFWLSGSKEALLKVFPSDEIFFH